MRKLQIGLLTILTLCLCTPLAHADTLDDVKFFVDMYYYGDIPDNLEGMTTVDEIMDSLDDYSRYLTAEEYEAYVVSIAQQATLPNMATVTPMSSEPAVASTMLYGNIGYLKITSFSTDLGHQVDQHWTKLKKAGATELIIDLRFNGGGYVDSAEQLLGFFQGVSSAYKLSTREGTRMVKPVGTHNKFPAKPYVLVNRYSASASEIVAVALKDQQAATLVGETTKGKGTIQSFFVFDDGAALKLTIGEFTGPEGTKVHKVGITPSIKTIHGKELVTIHRQLLTKAFATQHYKRMEDLQNVQTDKRFHVHFTQPMNFQDIQTSTNIELVKLGGASVPVTIQPSAGDTIEVIPKKRLQADGSYMLILHPGLQNTNGRTVKQGIFSLITSGGVQIHGGSARQEFDP